MKTSNFWYITLCALLVIASVNGWNTPLLIATVANVLVVLMNTLKKRVPKKDLVDDGSGHKGGIKNGN